MHQMRGFLNRLNEVEDLNNFTADHALKKVIQVWINRFAFNYNLLNVKRAAF